MAVIRERTWESKGTTQRAWVVDYKDAQGIRRFRTFKLQRQAKQALVKIQSELMEGTHTPNSVSATVREAAEIWYKSKARKERATLANYRRYLDAHIIPLLGRVKLAQLSKPAVAQFRDRLLKNTSAIQAQKILTAFRGILKEAGVRGMVSQNVALGITVEIDKRHTKRLEIGNGIPTKAEVKLMIDAAEGRWRPFVVTLAFAGLRASEARGLTWNDVDLDKQTITVRQRADRYNHIGSPKSKAGQRTISLGPLVTNVLREWKLKCRKAESGLVFPTMYDTPMYLSHILTDWFRPLQVKLGIVDGDGQPRYGLHALRHFCASHWIDQGFAPKKIQTWLGHSSITMTFDRYGHLMPDLDGDREKLAAGELSILG